MTFWRAIFQRGRPRPDPHSPQVKAQAEDVIARAQADERYLRARVAVLRGETPRPAAKERR